jgi:hypothetical protein
MPIVAWEPFNDSTDREAEIIWLRTTDTESESVNDSFYLRAQIGK